MKGEQARMCLRVFVCVLGGPRTAQGMYIYAEVSASSVSDRSLLKVGTSPITVPHVPVFSLDPPPRGRRALLHPSHSGDAQGERARLALLRHAVRLSCLRSSILEELRECFLCGPDLVMARLSVHYFLLDPSSSPRASGQHCKALSKRQGRTHVFLI